MKVKEMSGIGAGSKGKQKSLETGAMRTVYAYMRHNRISISGKKHKDLINIWAKGNGLVPKVKNNTNAGLREWLLTVVKDVRKSKPSIPKPKVNRIKKEKISVTYCRELRKKATVAEKRLRLLLGNCKIDYVFQKVITAKVSFYIVDFYLPNGHICLEVDGGYHEDATQKWKDQQRDLYLQEKGYQTLRFTNEAVMEMSEITLRNRINPFLDTI